MAEAKRLLAEFVPQEGTEYGWALAHAKASYAETLAVFKELDDKAATVTNALAGGAGVFTLGSLAAVGAAQVTPWAILAGVVPFALATVSVSYSIRARETAEVYPPPGGGKAVLLADYYHGKPALAEASMIPGWHLATVLNRATVRMKAGRVDTALFYMWLSVVALVLPLTVAAGNKLMQQSPEPAAKATP